MAPSWATAPCRPRAAVMPPASGTATVPSRSPTPTGRHRSSPTSKRRRHVRADGVVTFDFQPLPELADLRRSVYVEGKKVFDDDYLKGLTPLSLALWYMDDASLHRPLAWASRPARAAASLDVPTSASRPWSRPRGHVWSPTWPTPGTSVPSWSVEQPRQGDSGLLLGRDDQAACPDRAALCTRAWSTSSYRSSGDASPGRPGLHAHALRAGGPAGDRHPRQAANTVDAPL